MIGEVSTLTHELRDLEGKITTLEKMSSSLTRLLTHHTVEGAPLESETRLSSTQLSEVLRRLRDNIGPQLERDPAQLLAAGAQVKVDSGKSGLGGEVASTGRTPGSIGSYQHDKH